MGFIYNKVNLKDRRVNEIITRLYKVLTNLLVLESQAESLINESSETSYISTYSGGILPLGTELCLNWTDLGFNTALTSNSNPQFIYSEFSSSTGTYTPTKNPILKPDFKEVSETLPDGVSVLSNNLKIKDGLVILENLEKYDYDYESYEILSEVYQAILIILNAVEGFYSEFYIKDYEQYLEENNLSSDGRENSYILIYDTRDMDEELENVIFPIADTIADATNREIVKQRYRQIRDNIKFFCMDTAVYKIENYIDELLFCVNGSKKYSVFKHPDIRELIVTDDLIDSDASRITQSEEEVFFPFHNKYIIDKFTEGLVSTW